MDKFEKQGGVSFLLIYYTHKNLLYYLPFKHLKEFWERAKAGGRKSFRFDELDEKFVLPKKHGILVPYLDTLSLDVSERD